MKDLTGRCAVVTGGADGLGRAAGIALAEAGAKVVLVDIDQARLDESRELVAAKGGEVITQVADVRDPDSVEAYVQAAVDAFGSVDAFFNNAGIMSQQAPMHETSIEDFDRVLAVNLRGAFLGMRAVLRVMVGQRSGSIINVASMGSWGGIPQVGPYVVSKHGVVGLTRNAALEYAKLGIRVNAISPGNIVTKMGLGGGTGDVEAAKRALAAPIPQGRPGEASEIADAVVFLASDAATHVTGVNFPVDGGITAQVYPGTFGAEG